MTSRADIVATARKALETPWVHQGRLPVVGLDCAGLVLWAAGQNGMRPKNEPPPYPRNAKWDEFVGYFRRELTEIDWRSAREGSVLIFRQHIFPCHCGIMTVAGQDPFFIHSYLLRKRVVEERYTRQWQLSTVAAFDYPGVTE
jgi:cell wall-associated NlpC family hydrolase